MNDYDLILDYMTGSSVPDEFKRAIQRWIVDHSDEPEQVESMRKVWERELMLNRENRDVAGLSKLMSEIDPEWEDSSLAEFMTEQKGYESAFKKKIRKSIKFAAASVIVLVFASLSYFLYMHQADSTVVLTTAKGTTAEYSLPDGSRVLLNGNSRLSYNSKSFASDRKVSLEGEAYFDVVHKATHPFQVDMSGCVVEVLGTMFDARNYSHSALKEIVLLEGKVKVEEENGKNSVILHPDQRYVYYSDKGESKVEEVKAEEYCNWYLDNYKFEKEPLRKVLVILSRKHCLDLEIDPDVDIDRIISITITNEPVENVMGTISYIAGFDYEIVDNKLIIKNIQ